LGNSARHEEQGTNCELVVVARVQTFIYLPHKIYENMVAILHAFSTILLSLTAPVDERRVRSATTNDYNNMVTWLNNTFDKSFVSQSIELLPSERGGHGLFAKESIEAGSLLFSVPREACITASTVFNDGDYGKACQNLIKKAGPGAFTVGLAGYLAKEYLCYLEGEDVDFGPYLVTLPWKRNINEQEHVLFWTEDEIQTYLPGSLCFKECIDLRTEVKTAKKILNSLCGPSVLKARGEWVEEKPIIPFLEFTKPPPPTVQENVSGLGRAVTGAFVILLTRAFNDDFDNQIKAMTGEEESERLIPLLDMLNHNSEPSITYSTNEEGSVEVRARKNIELGDEIYNCYRKEEELNMPYHRFFSRFGFVPGISEPMKNLLQDKSSIFFAKRKEV
jgi:hypothetical protein